MWRRLLDQRFARPRPRSPVASRRTFRRRSPLLFEPLEPRLLLSADLLPADGVLEVVGTADDDSVLVREIQAAPGAAPRLAVVVNGESQDFALDEIRAIKVDLLGGDDVFVSSFSDASAKLSLAVMTGAGDDTVSHELSHVLQQGRPLVDADFNLGEGNNRFDARFLDTFGSVAVSASGAFENSESFTLSGNLIIGEEPDAPGLLAQVRGGDGRDLVTVDMSKLTIVGATREPLIRFDVDGGPGDDVLKIVNPLATRGGADAEPIDPAERSAPVSVRNHGREGDDSFDLTGSGAAEKYELRAVDEPQSARTFQFDVLDLATTNPLVEIGLLTVTHVALDAAGGDDVLDADIALDADWNLKLGDGDDVADLATLIGDRFGDAAYRLDMGDGDNAASLRFGDGEHGARPPSDSTRVAVGYRSGSGRDSVQFDWLAHVDRSLEVALDVSTGAGDDTVLVGLLLPAVQKAREAAGRVNVDLGGGDDSVRAAVTGFDDLALDIGTGSGNDSVWLDLGYPVTTQSAEITNRIAVDTGEGDDSVVATYNFYEAWPSKWKGTSLDVSTGGGDDFASLGFTGLPRDSGAPEAAAEPAEFAFDLGAGEDTLQVDAFGGSDAPVRIAFANVTGLGSEVSAVDYRAGAEIGGRFAGQVDMTGVEAVRLGTGAGDDRIDIDLDHPRVPPPKLAIAAGAGDDAIVASLEGVTGGAALSLDLGTGSDRVAVTWKGAPPHGVTDPLLLDIALGGADTDAYFRPELDDEVLVAFVSGSFDRPYIVGMAWNSEDVPQQGVKSLHVELSGAGGRTRISSVLTGGAGSDEVQVSVQGEQGPLFGLQLNAVFDLGAGDDSVQIDLSRLEIKGSEKPAPLSVQLLGGAGEDALRVVGTDGADRITVSGREVRLAGLAYIGYEGFESLYLDAGGGDDVVIMTAQNPGPPTVTLDGGAGRDRFVAGFDPGFFEPTLLNFEKTRTAGFTF